MVGDYFKSGGFYPGVSLYGDSSYPRSAGVALRWDFLRIFWEFISPAIGDFRKSGDFYSGDSGFLSPRFIYRG